MKQVILESLPVNISVKEVDEKKFYILHNTENNDYGLIHSRNYPTNDYVAFSLLSFTMGNSYVSTNGNLNTYIENMLQVPYVEVFEFDTAKEMFKYLAKHCD